MYLSTMLTIAVAAPLALNGLSAAAVMPRMPQQSAGAGSSCATDGALVCSADGTQFGLCNRGAVVFQAVAAGTACKCDSGQCGIVDGEGAANSAAASSSAAPPAPSASAPVGSSTVPLVPGSSTAPAGGYSSMPSGIIGGALPSTAGWNATSTAPAYGPPPASTSCAATATPFAGSKVNSTYFQQFNGDGSICDGWPSMAQWLSFDEMWESYMPILKTGCAAFGVPKNTKSELDCLKKDLQSTAAKAGLPVNFVFAIMTQESNGCLRVKTTNNGVVNPGIFQSHNGAGTCASVGSQPCPPSEILQMCEDGILGTGPPPSGGDGLEQVVKEAKGSLKDAETYYKAARLYNSGSLAGADLGAPGATRCYCSDIANRLVGWNQGASKCTLASA